MLQEFLILESGDEVAVYTPRTFPLGTPIGLDARRLSVEGSTRVQPPASHMTQAEFDGWRVDLERGGSSVSLGPYWRDPPSPEAIEDAIHGRAQTWTLEEVRDELLREAERREQAEARRAEPLKSRHP